MDMLLMGLCVSLVGIAFTGIAFAAATRPKWLDATAQPEIPAPKVVAAPARFFVDRVAPPSLPPHVPVELLLQQIENHVRLEHAAAEAFVAFPTYAKLHSKTTSSFLN